MLVNALVSNMEHKNPDTKEAAVEYEQEVGEVEGSHALVDVCTILFSLLMLTKEGEKQE